MSGHSWTALVVDDEAPVRSFIANCLKIKGIRALNASDGSSALELARAHAGPIHLLIADVHMPGMTGTELASTLTAERPGTRILIVSGEVSLRFERTLPSSWKFLRKPFPPAALLEAVGSLLASYPPAV